MTHCAHLYMLFEWVFCSHEMDVKTSHGVPVRASANRCGENFDGRSGFGDLTIQPLLSTSEDLGDENSSARSKLRRNTATFEHVFVRVKKTESPILVHICRGCTEFHQDLDRTLFFVAIISSNSCRSICH